MIPYEELVAALQGWRARQGLPTAAADYLGEPAPTDYSIMDTAVAADAIEEISDFDVADEVDVSGYAEDHDAGYGASPGDDDGYVASEPVEYQPAEIDAIRAGYAAEAFDDEQETAYSPVQSDAEVEEQVLDYSADYDDEGGATVIGGEVGSEPPALESAGLDAPVPAAELDMESFVPFDDEYDDDQAQAAQDAGAGEALGADAVPADDALPAAHGDDHGEGTMDVDVEMSADDIMSEAALPPPPPLGGFDDDDATSIAASAEPPPLAPPPMEPAEPADYEAEVESFDVIDEDDDPGRGA